MSGETYPSMTCASCGHLVTGRWTVDAVGEQGKGRDRRCACGRIVFIDGAFYERLEDRPK